MAAKKIPAPPAPPPPGGKHPVGHPTVYTPELAAEICRRLCGGETIKRICEDDGMPDRSTVYQWMRDDHEGFARQAERAREAGAYAMADDALDIADETSRDTIVTERGEQANSEWINRSRLRCDVRLKLMSKFNPRIFGEKIDHTSGGEKLTNTVFRSIINADGSVTCAPAGAQPAPGGADAPGA